jgi:hypothetical protein
MKVSYFSLFNGMRNDASYTFIEINKCFWFLYVTGLKINSQVLVIYMLQNP